MRALLLVCAVACVAGIAAAQSTTTPTPFALGPFSATVEPVQNGVHVYPKHAIDEDVGGVAFLCCTARADRSLDCRVANESPSRFGFGDAAMHFASAAHLTADSYAALLARPVQLFALAMRFQIANATVNTDAMAQQARTSATDLCGPGTGPAPDYIPVTGQKVTLTPGGERPGAHHSHTLGH